MPEKDRLKLAQEKVVEYLNAVEEYERCRKLAENALIHRLMLHCSMDNFEKGVLKQVIDAGYKNAVRKEAAAL